MSQRASFKADCDKIDEANRFYREVLGHVDEGFGITPEARAQMVGWIKSAARWAKTMREGAERLLGAWGLKLGRCPECESRGEVTDGCQLCGGSDRVVQVDRSWFD